VLLRAKIGIAIIQHPNGSSAFPIKSDRGRSISPDSVKSLKIVDQPTLKSHSGYPTPRYTINIVLFGSYIGIASIQQPNGSSAFPI